MNSVIQLFGGGVAYSPGLELSVALPRDYDTINRIVIVGADLVEEAILRYGNLVLCRFPAALFDGQKLFKLPIPDLPLVLLYSHPLTLELRMTSEPKWLPALMPDEMIPDLQAIALEYLGGDVDVGHTVSAWCDGWSFSEETDRGAFLSAPAPLMQFPSFQELSAATTASKIRVVGQRGDLQLCAGDGSVYALACGAKSRTFSPPLDLTGAVLVGEYDSALACNVRCIQADHDVQSPATDI
jgi:hypothetical protein